MYKALKTFSGKISMVKGEVRNIDDAEVVTDLLRAKYIVDLEEKRKATTKKTTKGGGKSE